jgi:tetratricopeptide (TPR) repeat protein
MQRTFICSFLLAGSAIIAAAAENAEDASTLVRQAEQAARDGKLDVAVEFVSKAIQTEPEGARLYALRARLQSALDRHVEAVADYDAALKIEPDSAVLYDARGSEQFMRGKIAESIGDFDKFLCLRPDQEPWHWKRGISYYYAGQYDKGIKQFEGYQPPEPTLPRVKSHHQEWVDACRGHGQTLAPYSYAAVLTESLLLGNVALRTGKALQWDHEAMRATGTPEADQFTKPEFRTGWSL